MRGHTEDLIWENGTVPHSRRFRDPYFSPQDGLGETRHVFLSGNRLPGAFRDGFHIAELGFGTGLNLLAAWASWQASGTKGTLRYTSFEKYPMAIADMARALSGFPAIEAQAGRFLDVWNDSGHCALPGLEFTLVVGDARQTLPDWTGQANAWFLDGFAPARNPELWETDLLAHVFRCTVPSGTTATYSAAGMVRRNLAAAGFDVVRVCGFGRKRHMTRAVRP